MNKLANVAALIEEHRAEFQNPNVLAVRAGYVFQDCWPTLTPVVVVTVKPGAKDVRVARHINGVPVDVRPATEVEEFLFEDPERAAQLAVHRAEFRSDAFPDGGGQRLAPAAPGVDLAAVRPSLPYTPPEGVALSPVSGIMTITCHASPDAGWPELRGFLHGTQSSLTVGMYDFTSQHILEALKNSLLGAQKLEMTLDNPARNPTADQSDSDSVQQLTDRLADRFQGAWALVRSNSAVNQWIYPSAYHIKVAVRDGRATWLSSGNWNNSNQPEMDPLNNPQEALDQQLARKSDRDWHVIIEHRGIAQTFEAYLAHDFTVAHAQMAGGAGVMAQAPMVLPPSVMASGSFQFHPPLRLENEMMRITPLLTPDPSVYQPAMLALINSATTKLYIQLQYIHPSDNPGDAGLTELIDAVAAKISAGVDVRIIVSQWQGQNGWLERLQAANVDLQHVKLQNGVHNKGFVIDSRAVALGSQNWSGDGVLRNRDASVIIEHDQAARYYEQIFLHDWDRIAKQTVSH